VIRIVIVENRSLLRESLAALLNQQDDMEVLGCAVDLDHALELLGSSPAPHLVLTELHFGGSLTLGFIERSSKDHPHVSLLVLSESYSHELVRSALLAGVDGYVLKSSTSDELIRAIRQVAGGATYFSETINNLLVDGYLDSTKSRSSQRGQSDHDSLTQREREVLTLVAGGQTNKQIASALHVSVKTVEKHRANFMRKLGLHNSAQVAQYAMSRGYTGAKGEDDIDQSLDEELILITERRLK
jgi:DNA-binding NarL/FixJ family response regulator